MATPRFSAGCDKMFGTHVKIFAQLALAYIAKFELTRGGSAYTQPNAKIRKTYCTMCWVTQVTTMKKTVPIEAAMVINRGFALK